jgi:hypothetical protein
VPIISLQLSSPQHHLFLRKVVLSKSRHRRGMEPQPHSSGGSWLIHLKTLASVLLHSLERAMKQVRVIIMMYRLEVPLNHI